MPVNILHSYHILCQFESNKRFANNIYIKMLNNVRCFFMPYALRPTTVQNAPDVYINYGYDSNKYICIYGCQLSSPI